MRYGPEAALGSLGSEEGGRGLTVLGAVLRLAGHREEARALYEQPLDIHRELGNPRREAGVLGNMGSLAGHQHPDEARADFEQALAIHRETGCRRHEGIALGPSARRMADMRHCRRSYRPVAAGPS